MRTKELFIAWEETGIRITHLRVSANHVRKRVDRPSEVNAREPFSMSSRRRTCVGSDDQQTSSESDTNA